MLFESYRWTSKFINSIWYTESLYQWLILKYPRFKSCERIYTIDFSLFSQNQIYLFPIWRCIITPNEM